MPHHFQKSHPCVRILTVYPEMFREFPNPSGKDGYLNFNGTRIAFGLLILLNDLRLFISIHVL